MKDGRLQASDLMAGDLAKLSKGNWFENRKVELIDIEMIAESVYLAEPIPITKEILEKIGLRKGYAAEYYDQDIYSDEFDTFGLIEGIDGSYVFETYIGWCERHSDGSPKDYGISATNVITGIKYLHELQHALKLCKIEKKIEL